MDEIRALLREEEAMSTVEILLIVVVIIGLIVIFKTQLTSLVQTVLSKIQSESSKI